MKDIVGWWNNYWILPFHFNNEEEFYDWRILFIDI